MRYFFNLRSTALSDLVDVVGDELSDDEAAVSLATRLVSRMTTCKDFNWRHCSYEIYDDAGRHVGSVWF